MVTPPDWAPPGINTSKASTARMYDYMLGGQHNFAVDREAVARVEEVDPDIRRLARANREFLQRAVQFLAEEAGVRQFLDLGSGIPTAGNVHEVAPQERGLRGQRRGGGCAQQNDPARRATRHHRLRGPA